MNIHKRTTSVPLDGITPLCVKVALALWVAAKIAPLGVARRLFRPTKLVPRALIGAILVTTVAIKLVLTGPIGLIQ